MAGNSNGDPGKKWVLLGKSVTTPKHPDKKPKEVVISLPYAVVGFEVNNEAAFTEIDLMPDNKFFNPLDVHSKHWVHHLDEDYGHAFFYIVQYDKVVEFFSFGPNGKGKVGWMNKGGGSHAPNKWDLGAVIKEGHADSRPGTPDYEVGEDTRLFRIDLTVEQYSILIKETTKQRELITSGKQKYTAWVNDTCAETARDVFVAAGINTPSGTGLIQKSVVWVYAVTPYMWYHNFKKEGRKEARISKRKRTWEVIMGDAKGHEIVAFDPAASQWK